MNEWHPFENEPRRESVWVRDVELRSGSRVRLQPRGRADILDVILAGKMARVEGVEQDYEGRVFLAVVVEDDPGQDLGAQWQPGHRFFFRPEEVEPVRESEAPS